MKKRNIVYGLIALEVISIPVSAKVIDNFLHAIPQSVMVTELPTEKDGLAKFVINSNTPFAITSESFKGYVNVKVTQTGEISSTAFGQKAQMPGPSKVCAAPQIEDTSIIYTGNQRTATKRGDVLSQSVVVEIAYAANAKPTFDVLTTRSVEGLPKAPACKTLRT